MSISEDATLDDIRLAMGPHIARAAVFDGWSDDALEAAAQAAGVKPSVAKLAFKGGAMDMIAAWVANVDAAMFDRFSDGSLDNMKIRNRIAELVWFRLEQLAGLEEALSRALAIQAMPQNLARAMSLGWSGADKMWRLAGDTATDYNHYSKRAILASIYGACLAIYVNDESEDKAESRAFLDRRIDGVMQFEKTKAQLLKSREGFDFARFMGRLRYPQN